ncbi:MAG: hypothetical protein HXY37_03065 [Chloroflexi bacterium]|nr:hypothetical protein [Chloroflexota bacterium]
MLHHSRPVLLIAVLLIGLAFVGAASGPSAAQSPVRLYLPLIRQTGVAPPNVFGIEMSQLTTERGLRLMSVSGTSWVRRGALHWKLVEPQAGGGYRWDAPAIKALEQDMLTASELGVNLVVTVYASPRWATVPYQADCAPINPQHYQDFARFLAAAVQRYSGPPYNLRHWEIGNEPDATLFPDDSVFGCWGIEDDPYYGGRAYGELLKVVYPAMKAANPNVVVLNGGLLLDRPYDPADPNSLAGRFFEGMLVAGAGNAFDVLSFHTYTFWRTPGWPALGAPVDWRVSYLKELLARYGVAEKPLIRTEGALLCAGEVTPECRWAQADYLSRLFTRSLRDGLAANIWYVYDSDSYHNTALIEPGDVLVPRPGYFAYRHASRTLAGARYLGQLAGVPEDVEGYVLRRGDEHIVVIWSDQPRLVAVPLPASGQVSCTNRDGGPVACPADERAAVVDVQTGATYIVVAP